MSSNPQTHEILEHAVSVLSDRAYSAEERSYIFPHDQKVKPKIRPMFEATVESVYGKVGIN